MKMTLDDLLHKYDGRVNPKVIKRYLDPQESPDAYELCQAAQDMLNKAQACGISDLEDVEYEEFIESRNNFISMLEDLDLYDQEGV